MRIDRYVYDERLTWGAASVLLAVAIVHAGAIVRLLIVPPLPPLAQEVPPPVFEISLQKLPPPRLPPAEPEPIDLSRPPPPEEIRPPPRQTRPVPILVDTPTTDPVPPGTQVKPYEIGDELLPGVPGPPVTGGTPDGVGFDSPDPRAPTYAQLKLLHFVEPRYPLACLRMQIEGRVEVRVLVGENGRAQEVAVLASSGNAALDQSALDAVSRWRFQAATLDGVPVRAWVKVPVTFRLIEKS